MSWTALLLLLPLQGAEPAPGAEPRSKDNAVEVALEPRLRDALDDLQGRDGRAFHELRRALKRSPGQARERLEQHAHYLDELRRAKTENPRRYTLLLEQQVSELEVADAAETLRAATSREEREAARSTLRGILSQSFELRHELRELQLEEMRAHLATERTRLKQATEDPAAARDAWLDRAAEDEVPGDDGQLDLKERAPELIEAVMRRDPMSGRRLARLSQVAPGHFLKKLGELVQEHPELLEEARRGEADGVEPHRKLMRSRAEKLRKRVRPFVERRGHRGSRGEPKRWKRLLPPEEQEALEPVLDDLVEAEQSITRFHHKRMEQRLAEQREILDDRRAHKDVIVDLRLAEITGERDRFEW